MKHLEKITILFLLTLFISCNIIHDLSCNKKVACKKHPHFLEDKKRDFVNNYNNANNYIYEDFPNEDQSHGNILNEDVFSDGGKHRVGKIVDGYKEGKWISGDAGFDANANVTQNGSIWREEYFKHGLRDSIFKQYDANGKVIYETTFKMGTGLWKEFHPNGKIYFEAYTKDGYFTDTLKLYNTKRELAQKRLYENDSLVYKKDLIFDVNPNDN